jgi:hypothetical protein
LVSYIIRLLQCSEVQEVLPAEVRVHFLGDESVERIQHSQMVSILMDEFFLGGISFNLGFSRTMENVWNTQKRDDCKNFLGAVILL